MESLNNADLITVKRSMLTVEFEIKISRADLINEIKAIKEAVKIYKKGFKSAAELQKYIWSEWRKERKEELKISCTKFGKHRRYLHAKKFKEYVSDFVPNEFYFFVPKKLKDVALQGIEDTPYGVYGYWKFKLSGEERFGFEIVKKAQKITTEKIDLETVLHLARKASNDCYLLRREKEEK